MRTFNFPGVITAIALAVAPLVGFAEYHSEVTVWSVIPTFPDQSDGGRDIGSAEASGFAEWSPGDYTQGFSGSARASAATGQLSSSAVATAWVDASAPHYRPGGDGSVNLWTIDDFTLSPGSSGLVDGDPVQVRLQVRIHGQVVIGGVPSGITLMDIDVGTNVFGAPSVDYFTGFLAPPLDLEVNEYWDLLIDSEIGSVLQVDTRMDGGPGRTDWPPDTDDRSYMIFAAEVAVSHAPGFETIGIDSDAGAPTVPLVSPEDADSDGIPNTVDNCIVTANTSQRDTNGDNFGNACDPDLDNDCLINFGDLARFRSAFHPRPYDPDADFDGDGFVNFGDLAVMRQFFLASPGPTNLTDVCDPAPFTSGAFTAEADGWLDLDLGTTVADDSPPSDIHWRVVTAHDAVLRPTNGAALALMGTAVPSYADCVAAPLSTIDTDLWRVDVGSWLCAVTDEGRRVRLQVTAADDGNLARATQMDLGFTTWP